MKAHAAICLSTALLTAAIPNVVPTRFSNPALGCRSWPQNPYMIKVDSADDAAINNLPVQPFNVIFASQPRPLLAVDLRASRRIAKQPYICIDGSPALRSSVGEKLGIARDRNNAHILVDAPAEKVLRPELYTHSVDGQQQEGFYIGVNNQTTWGFRYQAATCNANGALATSAYYEAKLLGLPQSEDDSAGYEMEFEGFLRLDERYF
ncbi:hypothetical protein ACN47E_006252 [Coniothyrium glycines]